MEELLLSSTKTTTNTNDSLVPSTSSSSTATTSTKTSSFPQQQQLPSLSSSTTIGGTSSSNGSSTREEEEVTTTTTTTTTTTDTTRLDQNDHRPFPQQQQQQQQHNNNNNNNNDHDHEVIEILDDDEVCPVVSTTTTTSSNGTSNGMDIDPEVSIVDPPPRRSSSYLCPPSYDNNDGGGGNNTNNNDQDDNGEEDELQVVSSNIINPNIHFPHKRPNCGVYSWSKDMNVAESFCPKCYCVVCDIPSKECLQWADHCTKDGTEVELQRQNKKRRRIQRQQQRRQQQRRRQRQRDSSDDEFAFDFDETDSDDNSCSDDDNSSDYDTNDDDDERSVVDDVLLESPTITARNVAIAAAAAATASASTSTTSVPIGTLFQRGHRRRGLPPPHSSFVPLDFFPNVPELRVGRMNIIQSAPAATATNGPMIRNPTLESRFRGPMIRDPILESRIRGRDPPGTIHRWLATAQTTSTGPVPSIFSSHDDNDEEDRNDGRCSDHDENCDDDDDNDNAAPVVDDTTMLESPTIIARNAAMDATTAAISASTATLRIVDVLALKLNHALQFSEGGRRLLLSQDHHHHHNANDDDNNNKIAGRCCEEQRQHGSNNKNSKDGTAGNRAIVPSGSGVELYKMEGDIPQLGLHSSFFVEGVKIGWPFPVILTPQRLMAIHIIKALKRRLHVVLESPTGTGKSAAILCSVLAWQRYHMQTNQGGRDDSDDDVVIEEEELLLAENGGETGSGTALPRPKMARSVPQIIYCSRTHSQVAQMVSSLKKTPYRPRMTVLGSRDRMCIHKAIKGGGEKATTTTTKSVPINLACKARRANTERQRRRLLKDRTNSYDKSIYDDQTSSYDKSIYDDDDPQPFPGSDEITQVEWPEDGEHGGGGDLDGNGDNGGNNNNSNNTGGDGLGMSIVGESSRPRRTAPTCPHFRQLTSLRTATMAADRLVGDPTKTSCCSTGGEESSFGVHDMEDLVSFGKNPYYEDNISIYRSDGTEKFGLVLSPNKVGITNQVIQGCKVNKVSKGGAAYVESRVKVGDQILKVNGRDVRSWTLGQVVEAIQATPKNVPLRLAVLRADSDTSELLDQGQFPVPSTTQSHQRQGAGDDYEIPYSEHSPCPYYLSRAIHAHTELTFAPYNYILDPVIRRALKISLKNKVIVLDEAHNVESTLCEGGSGKYSEIELCQLVSSLAFYARRTEKTGNIKIMGSKEKVDTVEVAHGLMVFVENLIFHLQKLRQNFENSPAKTKLGADYQRFRNIPDNHEVELTYDGPTGFGLRGAPVGCQPFLERLGLTKDSCSKLLDWALSMEQAMFGGSQDGTTSDQQDASQDGTTSDQQNASTSNVLTILVELLSKLRTAAEHPEHFYISCIVQANGNLDHALGLGTENSTRRRNKKPRKIPLISPRSTQHPDAFLPVCHHPQCSQGRSAVRHGEYCNGRLPQWEALLVLKLLSPGLLLKDISRECRSLILASGSLAPLPSLCAELDLFGKEGPPGAETPSSQSQSLSLSSSPSDGTTTTEGSFVGRLQTLPKPLEANHVIDLPKQLFAVSIGHFPDGQSLTVTYNNFKQTTFYPKLGHAICCVIESIPKGGVLVFFPSYSFLDKCVSCWNPANHSEGYPWHGERPLLDVWQRLLRSKGKVIVESTAGQEAFEAARDEYKETIKTSGSCILLAVFRGKMSEGISFNDDNARGVICVGMPYPNARERSVTAKKAYNDEQRKLRKKTCLLPGQEWYTQQASRAVAQALGRCIRHGADFGTVVLMDSRYCDDGAPNDGICHAHKNLPKWMRSCVRTLSMQTDSGVGGNPILGGYAGLQMEMMSFFGQAPSVSQAVRKKWKEDLEKAKALSNGSSERVFDNVTARWNSSIYPEKMSKD